MQLEQLMKDQLFLGFIQFTFYFLPLLFFCCALTRCLCIIPGSAVDFYLFNFFIVVLGGGYTVAFTKVLAMYQIHHT
jgi:hypothetical protein